MAKKKIQFMCTAFRDAGSKQAVRTVPAVVVGFWIALIPAVVACLVNRSS